MDPVYPGADGLEEFTAALAYARHMVDGLVGTEASTMTHGQAEQYIKKHGNEFMRRMLQGFLNHRAAQEARQPLVVGGDDIERISRRRRERPLESLFGEVSVHRRAYEHEGAVSLHPLDAELNLPAAKYSHGLERIVAQEVAKCSVEAAGAVIDRLTGGHVPKRQILETTIKVAQDFERFYTQCLRGYPENKDGHLLVLTTDGKGIVMRRDGLRESTRRAAEQEQHKKVLRLSKGEKRNRKRMATVASVYSIEPQPRTAQDVLHLHDEVEPAPARKRPVNKRVWASVARTSDQVADELIAEAEGRDPQHRRQWVVLVDGDPRQLRRIKRALRRRGITATIVLDLIHVLEYLWKAAYGFYAEDDPAVEAWVLERAQAVLNGAASQVAAGMRRSATKRNLPKVKRKPIDRCAGYLLKYKALLHYDEYLARGFPIATGVIEGACRHLIKDRLDITGARWSLPGAEAVLKLRSLSSSGDFDEYFTFYQKQEYQRNYAAHFKPDPIERAA